MKIKRRNDDEGSLSEALGLLLEADGIIVGEQRLKLQFKTVLSNDPNEIL